MTAPDDYARAHKTELALEDQKQETARWRRLAEMRAGQIVTLRQRVILAASGEACKRCALARPG